MRDGSGFLDPAGFSFTGALERRAPAIRAELDRLLPGGRFRPWPERELYDQGWEVFGLYLFGKPLPEGCATCPRTAEAIEQVSNVTTAGFSRLAPGTHIRPHVGLNPNVLRCHLGLIVPPGCELRVGDETRGWEENRCLVFDDTLEHEAWNRSEGERVVLLLDFMKEPAPRPGVRARP